jgi:hypothetical protein
MQVTATLSRNHIFYFSLQHITDKIKRSGFFLSYKQTLEEVAHQTSDFYQALGHLHHGAIPTNLVDYSQLESAFEKVSERRYVNANVLVLEILVLYIK